MQGTGRHAPGAKRTARAVGACALASALIALVTAGACGGDPPVDPDAAEPPPDAGPMPDAPDIIYPACREVEDPVATIVALPALHAGDLDGAGADMTSPTGCDVVDAPFGIATAGVDAVYRVDGLVPGTTYVVRLSSASDLGFYVVTGCSTATGPAGNECMLFVDATVDGAEVGTFEAPAAGDGGAEVPVYLVVDYYATGAPPYGDFTLELYERECETSGECDGAEPVCRDGRCAGCASDFDCDSPLLPLCDVDTAACVGGYAACTGDDAAREQGDDGPAGATPLASGVPVTGAICDNPAAERDFFRFTVDTPGEHWRVELDWPSFVDLDVIVFSAAGDEFGLSYYEQPERIDLTYLPAGDYYVGIDFFGAGTTTTSVPYEVTATRLGTGACDGPADCAQTYRNQIFRGDCVAGACEPIDGLGQRTPGQRCDSDSDCTPDANCASFFFTSDADTRMVCGSYCDVDADCAGLGDDFVCTTYLVENFCVQKCTEDDHCPTLPNSTPTTLPWLRLDCQLTTGRCLPP